MSKPLPTSVPPPWVPPTNVREFRTDRLVIRPYRLEDAAALFAAVVLSRASLLPWLPWARVTHTSVEESRASIERFDQAMADPLAPENNSVFGFVMGVFCSRTGEFVAGTGLNRMDAATHNAETGYWVRADRRREGWCSDALRATLSWAFLPQTEGGFGLRRVHIFASAANVASCGVPRRLGLRQHMHARLDRFVDGIGWTDTVGWDVLATEWDGRTHELRQG
jgi:ribosomal-protein-serine acetyltransferase